MKKTTIVLIFILSVMTGKINAQGIDFQHITLDQAKKIAKNENKLIFIDFHTVWCGPCKGMAKNVFTKAEVGKLFNKEFINLKLDAEKEGKDVAKKYKVSSYPTLMVLDHNGEVVYRNIGGLTVDGTIALGEAALKSVNSDYSLVKLKELFPQKQDDEKFLKMYFTKLKEYGERPTEGIEAWLKVQTEIKERDVDMMEFLMENSKYLIVDGKAQEIFYANYDEYWDIATRLEESKLKHMKHQFVDNTKELAFKQGNPELMRAFINNWKELPDENKQGKLYEFELTYLWFKKDYEGYKKLANSSLDSVMSAKTIEQIRADDKIIYEAYVKKIGDRVSLISDAIKANLKLGKEARLQMLSILKVGKGYLMHCNKKAEYKKLLKWVDYGMELVPTDAIIVDFKAKVLYQQGKEKQAIELKEKALVMLPQKDKKRSAMERQLEQMKKGEKL